MAVSYTHLDVYKRQVKLGADLQTGINTQDHVITAVSVYTSNKSVCVKPV